MHIAFALTGDLLRARDSLAKARQAAERLGPTEDIFTVKNYTEVPRKEFLAINDEMLAALDRGQLWDSMPLPPPAGPVANQQPTPPEDSKSPDADPSPPRRVGRRFDFEE